MPHYKTLDRWIHYRCHTIRRLTDEYIIDDILKDGCKMNDLLKDTLEEARLANTSDMPVVQMHKKLIDLELK